MNYEAELYRVFDSDPEPVAEFLEWLAERHGLPATTHVLDVGCGPGRMFGPLTELGWRVTGLEPDPAYFGPAIEQAEKYDLVSSVHQAGFNDVASEAAYDLICGINGSFAYVLTPEARADALERAFRALRAGGMLFLDLPNLLRILMEYEGPGEFTATFRGRPARLIRRHQVDYHGAVFTTTDEYTYVDEAGEERTFFKEHPYAMVSYPDLSYLLRNVGFEGLETYRSYESRAPQPIGPGRMLVVATKPGRTGG